MKENYKNPDAEILLLEFPDIMLTSSPAEEPEDSGNPNKDKDYTQRY